MTGCLYEAAIDIFSAGVSLIDAMHAQDSALDFIGRRLEQLLVDRGTTPEAARAVLKERRHDPSLAAATCQSLQVGLGN